MTAADHGGSDTGVTTVVAAGGVVLERRPEGTRVLVVHRPVHDDWSLPKGHVDPGEGPDGAALREVAEETGVAATVVRAAGETEHTMTVASGPARKRVHWFEMRPLPGADPDARAPDSEVDRATWWPTERALVELTYAGERDLLARLLAGSV